MATERHTGSKTGLNGIQGYLGLRTTLLLVVVGAALIGLGYYQFSRSADGIFDRKIAAISQNVMRETEDSLFLRTRPNLAYIAQGILGDAGNLEQRLVLLPVLNIMLRTVPVVHSIFVGYDDGDLFMVAALDTDEKRKEYSAPPESKLAVVNLDTERNGKHFDILFYDGDVNLIFRTTDDDTRGFDPRNGEWYAEAMAASGVIKTDPIWVDLPAFILAQRTRPGTSVIGMAILLGDISQLLKRELPTAGSHLALFRGDGVPVASDLTIAVKDGGVPRLRKLDDLPSAIRAGVGQYRNGVRGAGIQLRDNGRQWDVSIEEFVYNGNRDIRNFMVLAIPRDEILSDARGFLRYALIALFGILLIALPVVLLMTRRITKPLKWMTKQARTDFGTFGDGKKMEYCGVTEIDDLAEGIGDLRWYLDKILTMLRSIKAERDITRLIRRVFQDTVAMSGADGAGIVFVDGQGKFAEKGYGYWIGDEVRTISVSRMNHSGGGCTLDAIQNAIADKRPILKSVYREICDTWDEALAPGFADPGVARIDTGCFALTTRNGVILGVICFFRRAAAEGMQITPGQSAFWGSLVATMSVVLETQSLIKGQYDLRDALIHILAGAIDARSAYTGNHCARVPVIFQMLVEAACDDRDGPLADYQLDEDKREEARLAAWLHDCGKVTTPLYVMDKATKLETHYDRIHEIRTRFEVLKRDAEIASLRALADGADREAEQARLEAELRGLDDDFAFVASCNSGDKQMDDGTRERLAAIGARTWRRTLDKRLGVSRDELARMGNGEAPPPQAMETLLADNPEHIIPRGPADMLDADNPWGFKLTVPEHLYNRGELYNLLVPRGTLTPEERYKINDHITQTIIMLKRLPLPKELADMPEIAGAHHETMDGKGYPRKLTRDQMSWTARMMAIADVFEALTAWDRPYKNSKTVSEALRIMDGMKAANHIDPDLYDLFLAARIPQRYAKEYLKPEQNDLPMGEAS